MHNKKYSMQKGEIEASNPRGENRMPLKGLEEKLMTSKENGNVGNNTVAESTEPMLHFYNMLS